MFLLARPDPSAIARFIEGQETEEFSYPQVGHTRDDPPEGYVTDRYGTLLGRGEELFHRAVEAVFQWKVYPHEWVTPFPAEGPPTEGLTYAVLVRHLGFWSLNGCRVVYLVHEEGVFERRGFALGTLPGHEEQGEERFRVSWDRRLDEVRYDVLAFSRPRRLLARAAWPVTRALQRRFARDTQRAMLAATR